MMKRLSLLSAFVVIQSLNAAPIPDNLSVDINLLAPIPIELNNYKSDLEGAVQNSALRTELVFRLDRHKPVHVTGLQKNVTYTVAVSPLRIGESICEATPSVKNFIAGSISSIQIRYSCHKEVSQPELFPAKITPQTISYIAPQGSPVEINGQLRVCGNMLCNQQGQPIQLRGMSTHGLQWYGWGDCITSSSLDALVNSFHANVLRISMYVQEGGYATNPSKFTNMVNTIIDEASRRGIYAVIDFHQLNPGDPNFNLDRAKRFFTDIATANRGRNNLIYEICNEPSGVTWNKILSYANNLIPVIRAIDPVTPIVVGTRGWSSLGVSDGTSSREIIENPVNFPNILYAFHFYAGSHKQRYLDELDKTADTLPIFVTEWGTQKATGGGRNNFDWSQRYVTLMSDKLISWTNWNYSDDRRSGAIWKMRTCSQGTWTDNRLKRAGVWVKERIQTG